MKKFILLVLLPVIISGCALIPKKSSQQNVSDGNEKQFISNEFNFRIKYPNNWSISQSSVDRGKLKYESFLLNPSGSGEPDSYSISVYKSLNNLIDGDKYQNLEQWIKGHEDNFFSYNKTKSFGGTTYEGYWPSADETYSFYTEHNGYIYNLDITWIYPNDLKKDKSTNQPIFSDQTKRFMASFSFIK